MYQTQDTERNTMQEKHRVGQFDHIMHMNLMTDSCLCAKQDD